MKEFPKLTPVKFLLLATAFLSFLLTVHGCGRPGLHRTSFDDWQTADLLYIGARIELPTNVYRVVDSPIGAGIFMHPYNPPRLILSEPRCLLEFRVERIAEQELADAQARSQRKERDNDSDSAFWNWYHARHDTLDRMDERRYSYYRYDVGCGDGTLLKMRVEIMTSAEGQSPEGLAEDDAAIRRILGSVECREPMPMPTVARE